MRAAHLCRILLIRNGKRPFSGNVDIRTFEALAAIPGLDKGNVEMQLTGQGTKSSFIVDGQGKVTDGTYRTGTIHLVGVNAKTAIHITEDELALTNAQAKLPGGGTVDGTLRIDPLAEYRARGSSRETGRNSRGTQGRCDSAGQQPAAGNCARAHQRNDAGRPSCPSLRRRQYRDLGFDTMVDGPVNVDWKGDPAAYVTDARLTLTAPAQAAPGLGPAQRDRRRAVCERQRDGEYSQPHGADSGDASCM